MNQNLADKFVEELKDILKDYSEIPNTIDALFNEKAIKFITRASSVIDRICKEKSTYYKMHNLILNDSSSLYHKTINIKGVLDGLLKDLSKGYLKNFEELISSEIFADYLEMGDYLLDEGYKDASAVIIGSTLEAHLRKLCEQNNIAHIKLNSEGKEKPKKADELNSELAKKEVYTKLELKEITFWLEIRNNAAHGHYDNYSSEDVNLMSKGVKHFITKFPARQNINSI